MTVLYCVVKSPEPITPPDGGLPGAESPRALPLAGGMSAVVATVPDAEYVPDVVESKLRDMDWVSKAALGHEQLLERMMRTASAVVPMKLLTLFSGDERVLKTLSKQRRQLERAAAAVEGCEEYGLRLVAIDAPFDSRSGQAASRERPSSGTAFLQRKKDARDTARDAASRRSAFARDAFDVLAREARDAVSRPAQQGDVERPLLDAAFLIANDQREAFGRAADRLSARAGEELCTFKLTGPWPPYHFVRMEHAS